MTPRILILGAGGRLGSALTRVWKEALGDRAILPIPRSALDLSNPLAIESFLTDLDGVGWIVNCAGATNLEFCEADPQLAWQVNADTPGTLARGCAAAGIRFLHFSTDYVFDGSKRTPFLETDTPSPLSVYGASKFAGEQQVLSASPDHMVARVSWVFGPDRPAFPDFMVEHAFTGENLSAVDDKWASPTYTLDIANWLLPFLSGNIPLPGGIYHLCNSGCCTWREYAEATLEIARETGLPVRTTRVNPIPMSAMTSWTAPRPVFTVLDLEKITTLLGKPPRPWTEAMRDHLLLRAQQTSRKNSP